MNTFTNWDILVHRINRVRAGLDTPWEFLLPFFSHASLYSQEKIPISTTFPSKKGWETSRLFSLYPVMTTILWAMLF